MLDQFREAFPPQDPFLGSRFSATNWTTPLPHVVPSMSSNSPGSCMTSSMSPDTTAMQHEVLSSLQDLEDLYLEEIRSGLLKYLWIFTHISTCRLIYHNIPHMEHMGSFSYGQSCSFGAIIHTPVMFHGDVELRHGIEGKKYKNKQYLEDMSL